MDAGNQEAEGGGMTGKYKIPTVRVYSPTFVSASATTVIQDPIYQELMKLREENRRLIELIWGRG